jgi:hypothetical protein
MMKNYFTLFMGFKGLSSKEYSSLFELFEDADQGVPLDLTN